MVFYPDIKINVSSYTEDGKVVLRFKDNGTGIDFEKYREKLSGLYQGFHDQGAGKGMGLFTVKTQVKALDGEIEDFSEPEKGTTFRMEFPLNQ